MFINRLLEAASGLKAGVSPKQRMVMEGALSLAIRLGLPSQSLLDKVLDPATGAAFYENFRRPASTSSLLALLIPSIALTSNEWSPMSN